jgi:hypothetical protein
VRVDVTTQTVVARPLPEVAAYLVDAGHAPEWYANIVRVEQLTPPPYAVGSRMRFEARFLGRTLVYTYEVTALDPASGLTMTTHEGPFPMTTVYAWAPHPDGTRVTLRNHGEPSGFGALAAPVMSGAMRRANKADLARLKAVLEA